VFTGIVVGTGQLLRRESRGDGARLVFAASVLPDSAFSLGASVAVNGCCLTVIASAPGRFEVDASVETLAHTTLGALPEGSPVNLEPPLAAGDALGGHLVSGHVDGVGEVISVRREAVGAWDVRIRLPGALMRFVATKGSISVDGVSLTVNSVSNSAVAVMLIPATRKCTILGACEPGVKVNIEVDLIARYLDRLLDSRGLNPGMRK